MPIAESMGARASASAVPVPVPAPVPGGSATRLVESDRVIFHGKEVLDFVSSCSDLLPPPNANRGLRQARWPGSLVVGERKKEVVDNRT